MRSPGKRLCIWLAAVAIPMMGVGAQGEDLRDTPIPALRVALLDFEDEAGFQGDWNLAQDVPELLGRYLAREEALAIISRDSVALAMRQKSVKQRLGLERAIEAGRLLQAEVVITGIVEKFGVRRFSAGDPNLIGYKKYNSSIEIKNVQLIKLSTQKVVETLEVYRDSTESPLGVDLFGRPRKQDREFLALFRVEFGSESFFELPFGKLADLVFKDLSAEIVQILVDRPPIDLSGDQAVVLAVEVEENEVYLGIGHADGLEYGDILPLGKEDERVALVRVHQLIGPHLCKAVILKGGEAVEVGLPIGQRVSRKQLIKEDVVPKKKEQ